LVVSREARRASEAAEEPPLFWDADPQPQASAYPPQFPSLCASSEDDCGSVRHSIHSALTSTYKSGMLGERHDYHNHCFTTNDERLMTTIHSHPCETPTAGRDNFRHFLSSLSRANHIFGTQISTMRGGCSSRFHGRMGPGAANFPFSRQKRDEALWRRVISGYYHQRPGPRQSTHCHPFAQPVHHILSANLGVGSRHGARQGAAGEFRTQDGPWNLRAAYHTGADRRNRYWWDGRCHPGAAGSRIYDGDAWLSPRGGRSTRLSRYLA
jgi:hypothetical protein